VCFRPSYWRPWTGSSAPDRALSAEVAREPSQDRPDPAGRPPTSVPVQPRLVVVVLLVVMTLGSGKAATPLSTNTFTSAWSTPASMPAVHGAPSLSWPWPDDLEV